MFFQKKYVFEKHSSIQCVDGLGDRIGSLENELGDSKLFRQSF